MRACWIVVVLSGVGARAWLRGGSGLRSCEVGSSVPFPSASGEIECVAFDEAYSTTMSFLLSNMPSFDAAKNVTLFGLPGGVDGLDTGVASLGVNMSLEAKARYPWAAEVNESVFVEYVASYAFTDEPRTNWRPFLLSTVEGMVANATSLEEAVSIVNGYEDVNVSVWKSLGISFKSSQTPLIYDPISTAAFGYASCTGVSTTFAAALRAIAVPARVAGTPAWLGDPSNGNHNWIEIYNTSTGEWHFIEPRPSGGGETLENPCDKWFCNPTKFPNASNSTPVYAARFDAHNNDSTYILAWNPTNLDVPGVDRSDYYRAACSVC